MMDVLDILKASKGKPYTPKEIGLMLQRDSSSVSRQLSSLNKHDLVMSEEVDVFGSKRKFYKFKL